MKSGDKAKKIEAFWLNKSMMARSVGVTDKTLDAWGVEPVARIGKSVYYTVASVLENRMTRCEQKNQPKQSKASGESIDPSEMEYEKYRLTKAQADHQELKNEVARKVVVPVDIATFVLGKVAAEISGILDGLPLTLYRKHPELTKVQQENIKRETAKAMNAMSRVSDNLEDYLDDYLRESGL